MGSKIYSAVSQQHQTYKQENSLLKKKKLFWPPHSIGGGQNLAARLELQNIHKHGGSSIVFGHDAGKLIVKYIKHESQFTCELRIF